MRPAPVAILVACILLIAILAAPVQAIQDPVRLSTGAADYQFSLQEEAQIPLTVTNIRTTDIPGTLVVRVSDPATGAVLSTQRREFTAFAGEEQYLIAAGTASREGDQVADISFEYGTGPVYAATLPGVGIRFTSDPQEAGDEPGDTTTPAGTPLSSTAAVKKEVPDTASYAATPAAGDTTPAEEYTDADALKQTLYDEQLEAEFRKDALVRTVTTDPVYREVNSTLTTGNFTPTAFAVQPRGDDGGTFSAHYTGADEETVTLTGSVQEGSIAFLTLNTTAPIALPPTFSENRTISTATTDLWTDGYARSRTVLNRSPGHANISLLFTKGIYEADIRAEAENGTVTAVRVDTDDIIPIYVFPIIILVFTCLNALVVYAWFTMKPDEREPGEPDAAGTLHPAGDAPDPLRPAELLYAAGHRAAAVSMAVRVLRVHVTAGQATGVEEVSDQDCRDALLAEENHHLTPETRNQILSVLQTTERQRFAGEKITKEEWQTLTNTVRRLIQG